MDTPWTDRTEETKEVLSFEAPVLKEIAKQITGETILDVGCGPQLLEAYHDGKYIGLDFEEQWGPDVVGSALQIPLSPSAVDTVVTKTTLQHNKDWKNGIEECCRVAESEVIFCERTHDNDTRIIAMEPVLRQRFNADEFVQEMKEYCKEVKHWTSKKDYRLEIYEGVL